MGNSKGTFSAGSCYDTNWNNGIADAAIWGKIWQSNLHERLKMFIWRVLADVVPTREKLNRHFVVGESSCCLCGAEVEDKMHLFKECLCFKALACASNWGEKLTPGLIPLCKSLLNYVCTLLL